MNASGISRALERYGEIEEREEPHRQHTARE